MVIDWLKKKHWSCKFLFRMKFKLFFSRHLFFIYAIWSLNVIRVSPPENWKSAHEHSRESVYGLRVAENFWKKCGQYRKCPWTEAKCQGPYTKLWAVKKNPEQIVTVNINSDSQQFFWAWKAICTLLNSQLLLIFPVKK